MYEFRKGSTTGEACKAICEAFGGPVVTIRTCKNWFKRFKAKDDSLEDKPRGGRPTRVSRKELGKFVRHNLHASTQEVGDALQVHRTTAAKALKREKFTKSLDEWVPHQLTKSNMADRVWVCSEL